MILTKWIHLKIMCVLKFSRKWSLWTICNLGQSIGGVAKMLCKLVCKNVSPNFCFRHTMVRVRIMKIMKFLPLLLLTSQTPPSFTWWIMKLDIIHCATVSLQIAWYLHIPTRIWTFQPSWCLICWAKMDTFSLVNYLLWVTFHLPFLFELLSVPYDLS